MPASSVLPSDSISQAPSRPRHHHHHHHHYSNSPRDRDRRSSGYNSHGPPSRENSDGMLLTEQNLAVHTSEALAAKRAAQLRERARGEIIVEDHEHDVYDDYEEEDDDDDDENEIEEVATLKQHYSGSASRSAAQSKVSSSRRSATAKSVRDLVNDPSTPVVAARERSPNKWVIVEVDEYPDKLVEREYTIERVRRYHYG